MPLLYECRPRAAPREPTPELRGGKQRSSSGITLLARSKPAASPVADQLRPDVFADPQSSTGRCGWRHHTARGRKSPGVHADPLLRCNAFARGWRAPAREHRMRFWRRSECLAERPVSQAGINLLRPACGRRSLSFEPKPSRPDRTPGKPLCKGAGFSGCRRRGRGLSRRSLTASSGSPCPPWSRRQAR